VPEAGGLINIEVAHHLSQHEASRDSPAREILEIFEAIVLAIVAIANRMERIPGSLVDWTSVGIVRRGQQTSKLRVQAAGTETIANEERLYNASTVAEWLNAEAHGDKRLADVFARRVLPEFRPAFEGVEKNGPPQQPGCSPWAILYASISELENGRGVQVQQRGNQKFLRKAIRPGSTLTNMCE
jgi:hypothetical protein